MWGQKEFEDKHFFSEFRRPGHHQTFCLAVAAAERQKFWGRKHYKDGVVTVWEGRKLLVEIIHFCSFQLKMCSSTLDKNNKMSVKTCHGLWSEI